MSGSLNVSKIINYVKEKIESCIQKYMSLEQTMTYLHENHQINHPIIRTIWEHLQKQNPDFFKEFYKRYEISRQIVTFNDLLSQQKNMMQKLRESDISITNTPVIQLQKPNDHHQDQLNHHHQNQLNHHNHQDQLNHYHHQDLDQWFPSNVFAYTENSISSLTEPSMFCSTSDFRNDNDLENLRFEKFARDLDQQQQRLELKVERQKQQRLELKIQRHQQELCLLLLSEQPHNLDSGKSS